MTVLSLFQVLTAVFKQGQQGAAGLNIFLHKSIPCLCGSLQTIVENSGLECGAAAFFNVTSLCYIDQISLWLHFYIRFSRFPLCDLFDLTVVFPG